jgi:hypothetical protein
MKKRRVARIVSGKIAGDACPNCMRMLDGVTAASLNGPFERFGPEGRVSVKGHATMCMYCGAMLMFADEEGHLRLMTAMERSTFRLHPDLSKLQERLRPKPPDFTKKSYN